VRVEVLDDHHREAPLRRKTFEKLAERLQPAGGSAHADDRKRVRDRLVHQPSI
jgi:hypothetical protein